MSRNTGGKGPHPHHNTVCVAIVLFVLAGGGGAQMQSLVPATGDPTCVAAELLASSQ